MSAELTKLLYNVPDSSDRYGIYFMNKKLFTTGLIGTVIAALCCFTPVLVILLGALGLSAIVGWLDYVLLPALVIFVAITIYALVTKTRDRHVT